MGEIPAGGGKEVAFFVTNSGNLPLAVARVETSCACLTIELTTDVLAPGEGVTARARIDLRAEPDFMGDLGISAKGVDRSGAVLFAIVVNVKVRCG